MVLVDKKYKILWYYYFLKYPISGICEESDWVLIFIRYKDLYKIYCPPDDIVLNIIENQSLYLKYVGNNNLPKRHGEKISYYYIGDYKSYNSKIKEFHLQKSWEVDLIKEKYLI